MGILSDVLMHAASDLHVGQVQPSSMMFDGRGCRRTPVCPGVPHHPHGTVSISSGNPHQLSAGKHIR